MKRNKKKAAEDQSGANTSLILNLSLFMMLLAFFIVLNALSSFEEKKFTPILQSLENTFASDSNWDAKSTSLREDPLQSVLEGDSIDRLNALFEAQISAFRATKSKSRGVMHVEMPFDVFYNAIIQIGQQELTQSNKDRIERDFFLPTLVSILKSEDQGAAYRMDIVLQMEQDPAVMQNNAPGDLKTVVNRVGGVARKLEEFGLPKNLMSIGLSKGKENTVELFFYKHVPFNPLADF